jgi:cytochrome P450
METRIALEAILDRLDDLKLDPAPGQDIRIEGLAFRSPVSLPVSFTAR